MRKIRLRKNREILQKNARKVVVNLVEELIKQFNLKEVVIFRNEWLNLFEGKKDIFNSFKFKTIREALEKLKEIDEVDFIFADLPIGNIEKEEIKDVKVKLNHFFIYRSLTKLSQKGKTLFIVEPSLFLSINKPFFAILNKEGFYINAVFLSPEGLFLPQISLRPYLIVVSRNKTKELFICELTEESDTQQIIKNFKDKINKKNIYVGTFIESHKFKDFERFKINQQIESLNTQYKEFKEVSLNQIALEINPYNKGFEDKPNSIYIPKIGKFEPKTSLNDLEIKPLNYIQIVLDENKVINEYLRIFFKSELGKLILESIKSGITKYINKDDLFSLNIPIPSIEFQKKLVNSYEKIDFLINKLNEFSKELSINPKKVSFVIEQLNPLLDSLNLLTEEERILEMIRKGENKYVEFKQALKKNIKTNQKDKNIENSALKEIVAFLNTDGGTLLIGVTDDQKIVGIKDDFFDSEDKYKLHFQNLVRDRIGVLALNYIDYKILTVLGKKIFVVYCKASDKPFFLNGREFYYRTDPATKKLEGKELLEYTKNRFKGSWGY